MALVSSDVKLTVKFTLEPEVAAKLEKYASFAGATRARVVETALDRLLLADKDWQAKLTQPTKEI